MKIGRTIRSLLTRSIVRRFDMWQTFGFHVTPVHFYQPIPDTRRLEPKIWTTSSSLVGIDLNEAAQLALLSVFKEHFSDEYDRFSLDQTSHASYYINNGNFESVDGEILYCMIRHFAPKRLIEIGSGFSTLAAGQALLRNKEEHRVETEFIAIEPYPMPIIENGIPALTDLRRQRVEDVPLDVFEALGENDILFIDSSHVLRIGGDVQYEYLEILPRLQPGVLIHIHDIFTPAEYPKEWVFQKHRFWNEQYVLQAFLCFNSQFEVLWGSSYMHLTHPDRLAEAFPSYQAERHWPGSFWIRRKK